MGGLPERIQRALSEPVRVFVESGERRAHSVDVDQAVGDEIMSAPNVGHRFNEFRCSRPQFLVRANTITEGKLSR